jgi:excisionase family DNA binding protein
MARVAQKPPTPPRKTPGSDPELYTIAEACDVLHISRMTLHRLIDAGKLPTVRLPGRDGRPGRTVRIRPADLTKLVEAHTTNGDKAPRQRRQNGNHN